MDARRLFLLLLCNFFYAVSGLSVNVGSQWTADRTLSGPLIVQDQELVVYYEISTNEPAESGSETNKALGHTFVSLGLVPSLTISNSTWSQTFSFGKDSWKHDRGYWELHLPCKTFTCTGSVHLGEWYGIVEMDVHTGLLQKVVSIVDPETEPIQLISEATPVMSPELGSFSRIVSSQSPCSPDVVVIATASEDLNIFLGLSYKSLQPDSVEWFDLTDVLCANMSSHWARDCDIGRLVDFKLTSDHLVILTSEAIFTILFSAHNSTKGFVRRIEIKSVTGGILLDNTRLSYTPTCNAEHLLNEVIMLVKQLPYPDAIPQILAISRYPFVSWLPLNLTDAVPILGIHLARSSRLLILDNHEDRHRVSLYPQKHLFTPQSSGMKPLYSPTAIPSSFTPYGACLETTGYHSFFYGNEIYRSYDSVSFHHLVTLSPGDYITTCATSIKHHTTLFLSHYNNIYIAKTGIADRIIKATESIDINLPYILFIDHLGDVYTGGVDDHHQTWIQPVDIMHHIEEASHIVQAPITIQHITATRFILWQAGYEGEQTSSHGGDEDHHGEEEEEEEEDEDHHGDEEEEEEEEDEDHHGEEEEEEEEEEEHHGEEEEEEEEEEEHHGDEEEEEEEEDHHEEEEEEEEEEEDDHHGDEDEEEEEDHGDEDEDASYGKNVLNKTVVGQVIVGGGMRLLITNIRLLSGGARVAMAYSQDPSIHDNMRTPDISENVVGLLLQESPCQHVMTPQLSVAKQPTIYMDVGDRFTFRVSASYVGQILQSEKAMLSVHVSNPSLIHVQTSRTYNRYGMETASITVRHAVHNQGVSSILVSIPSASLQCTDVSFTLTIQCTCPPTKRLHFIYDPPLSPYDFLYGNPNASLLTSLGVNYRPPSHLGISVPLTKNIYNADPSKPRLNDHYDISKESGFYKQCDGKMSREECKCTDEMRYSSLELFTDCREKVYRVTYTKHVYPRLIIRERGKEERVLDEPYILTIKEVNDREDFVIEAAHVEYMSEIGEIVGIPVKYLHSPRQLVIKFLATQLYHFRLSVIGGFSYCTLEDEFQVFVDRAPLPGLSQMIIFATVAVIMGGVVFIIYLHYARKSKVHRTRSMMALYEKNS